MEKIMDITDKRISLFCHISRLSRLKLRLAESSRMTKCYIIPVTTTGYAKRHIQTPDVESRRKRRDSQHQNMGNDSGSPKDFVSSHVSKTRKPG